MKKRIVKRLTLKIFPKFPLKISQKRDQRLVGKVLLAYSSLLSLPSSIRAISPFFCCAIINTPNFFLRPRRADFLSTHIYPLRARLKRAQDDFLSILLQICDYFKEFREKFEIISRNFPKKSPKAVFLLKKALTFRILCAKINAINRGADEHEYATPSAFLGRAHVCRHAERVSPPKRIPVPLALGIREKTCVTVTERDELFTPRALRSFYAAYFRTGTKFPSFYFSLWYHFFTKRSF